MNEPILGSTVIAGVKPNPDGNGNLVPARITIDDNFSPPRLVIELPDRALRDLGVVTVDGQIGASAETSTVFSGTSALTPQFASISASSSGNNNLVGAVASKQIRVLAYNFISNGTVNAKFQTDGAGTPADLTGLKYCVANMGICAPFNPVGWFQGAVGKTLDLNLSSGVAVGGELVYVAV